MNIKFLKKLNENLPDWVKLLMAPIIRDKLIKNPVFVDQYHELLIYDNLTQDEIEIKQIEKTKDLLIFAYENTQYYKALFDQLEFNPYQFSKLEELEQIPVLTKEQLGERFQDLVAENISNYYNASTGGTTGKPVNILLEKDSIYKEKAFIYHFWSKAGYDYKKSRIVTLRGIEFHGKISKVNPLYNEVLLNPFILSSNNIKQYINKINSFKGEFIHGYPSAIYNFCCLYEKQNIKLKKPIKAVFLISENSYPFQIEKIEKVLNCKCHMFYGHSERAVFAEECEHGKYEFNKMYGVTQFQSELGGYIICTGFLNRKQPLIRYIVDDNATLVDNDKWSIQGHWGKDVLYGANGERISMAAINFHDKTFANILAYQFEQTEPGNTLLRIEAEYQLSETELLKIKKGVESKLAQVIICNVQQVDKIKLSNRGKYQMLIQNIR